MSKKVASTLNWSHIYDITDNSIQLRKGKKQATVMGVKLSPHDIFIDDPEDQARIIENLRMALNKLPFRMFFSFVYSPVNADDHIANLMDADRIETDPIVKQMIQADFDKLVQFQNASCNDFTQYSQHIFCHLVVSNFISGVCRYNSKHYITNTDDVICNFFV